MVSYYDSSLELILPFPDDDDFSFWQDWGFSFLNFHHATLLFIFNSITRMIFPHLICEQYHSKNIKFTLCLHIVHCLELYRLLSHTLLALNLQPDHFEKVQLLCFTCDARMIRTKLVEKFFLLSKNPMKRQKVTMCLSVSQYFRTLSVAPNPLVLNEDIHLMNIYLN